MSRFWPLHPVAVDGPIVTLGMSDSDSSRDENWQAFEAAAVSCADITAHAKSVAERRKLPQQSPNQHKQVKGVKESQTFSDAGPGAKAASVDDQAVTSLAPYQNKLAAMLDARLASTFLLQPLLASGDKAPHKKLRSISPEVFQVFRKVKPGTPLTETTVKESMKVVSRTRTGSGALRSKSVKQDLNTLALLAVDGHELMQKGAFHALPACKLPAQGVVVDPKHFIPYDDRIPKLIGKRPRTF